MNQARNISKSMVAYLRKVREQKEFLLNETQQYERSKRHLANMMGLNEKELTQEDVDKAIKYLFPSGLFDPKARPCLKHPSVIFDQVPEAKFSTDGRPFESLFYTRFPKYYGAIGRITDSLDELDEHEDSQRRKGFLEPTENSQYSILGRRWLTFLELSTRFRERISESDYDYFIRSINVLHEHPYSSKAEPILNEFTTVLAGTSNNIIMPDILKDENGRNYCEIATRAREHRISTRVTFNGTGKFDIEGNDILYFESYTHRQNIFFPIQLSGMTDKIDITSKIISQPRILGKGALSTAIREAVARSIAAYVDEEKRERLRLAGLLTTDTRLKERKKYGQEGARRKFTWRKR